LEQLRSAAPAELPPVSAPPQVPRTTEHSKSAWGGFVKDEVLAELMAEHVALKKDTAFLYSIALTHCRGRHDAAVCIGG
jgi:hypothetical protein